MCVCVCVYMCVCVYAPVVVVVVVVHSNILVGFDKNMIQSRNRQLQMC